MTARWYKLAIGTKFAVVLAVVLLLTGAVTGGIVSRISASAHLNQRVQTLSVAAKMLAVHLEEYMSRLLDELEQLKRAVAIVPEESGRQLLEDFVESRPELIGVRYVGTPGNYAAGSWPAGEDFRPGAGKRKIEPATFSGGRAVLHLWARSESGLIVAQVSLSDLTRQQRLLDIRLGESGHPYLLDNSGNIISHSQQRYVGKHIAQLLTMRDGSAVSVDLFTGATFSLLEYRLDEEARLAGVVPLPELGLVVGFSQSDEEIRLPGTVLRRSLWAAVLLLTTVLLLAGLRMGSMVNRPLQQLLEQLAAIRDGHIYSVTNCGKSPELSAIGSAVNKLINRLHEMSVSTVAALVLTLEARDQATKGHSQRVSGIACRLAESMGCQPRSLQVLSRAALLHDVGKISVPDTILLKEGTLSKWEREVINSHPSVAARILAPLPFLREETQIIVQHHENVDGSGYPQGLSAKQIHPLAKILAVADAYEAMTADRPYRRALSVAEAVRRLQQGKGSQFDEAAVDAFVRMTERGSKHGLSPDLDAVGREETGAERGRLR